MPAHADAVEAVSEILARVGYNGVAVLSRDVPDAHYRNIPLLTRMIDEETRDEHLIAHADVLVQEACGGQILAERARAEVELHVPGPKSSSGRSRDKSS